MIQKLIRLRDLSTELRYAARGLLRDPIFTVTALLILAIGCGAHTAMSTAVHGLLLTPLPFDQPERLVSVYELRPGQGDRETTRLGVALETLPAWRRAQGLESLAGYRLRSFGFQTAREPSAGPDAELSGVAELSEVTVIQVGMSTAGLFHTLGVEPRLGRDFTAEEERLDRSVVVIGHALWHRAFNGSPDALGQSLWLNGTAHTVVGVLPEAFRMIIRDQVPDAYIPISHRDYGGGRSKRALEVTARLQPDADLATVRSELAALGERLSRAWPDTHRRVSIGVESLDTTWRGANRRPLGLLLGGAFLLLLIVCANVAGLMLARALRRRRRRAIQAALGAGAFRLALPSLLEGAWLGLLAGLGGLWIAKLLLEALPLALPVLGGTSPVPGFELRSLDLNLGSALAATTLAVICGLLFAAWPIWRLRKRQPVRDLGTSRGPSTELSRGTGVVVIAQVALGTLLLLTAGLLGRSFLALLHSDPGFDAGGVTSFGLGLPEARYGTETQIIDFHRELHRELAESAGVSEVGAAARRPLTRGFRASFEREGEAPAPSERLRSSINVVSSGYFKALRIPLVAGRLPDWNDGPDPPRVLVVNEAFHRVFLSAASDDPAESAAPTRSLGRRLRLSWWSELTPRGTSWEIVGIVGDVRRHALDAAPTPEIYLPLSQYPAEGATYLLLSRDGKPISNQQIAGVVAGLDPQLQKIQTGDARLWASESLSDRRLALWVLALFGSTALVVTAIGVYAFVAGDVAHRRSEIAVRAALGARREQLAGLVIGRSLRLVSIGFGLGAGGFLLLSPAVRRLLYGVGPTDPVTLLGVWVALTLLALLASIGPASRAARAGTDLR